MHHHHNVHPSTMLVLAEAGLPCEQHAADHVCHAGPLSPAAPTPGPIALPEGFYSMPLPGVRCPTCAKDGKEVWVIPGRACGYCGTACG